MIFRAVEIVNEVGAVRRNGIPELLPGLNFIGGLAGETAETFALNKAFLDRILASGLLVRRVNIRQLMPFEGTQAYENNCLGMHDKLFHQFKDNVRSTFDTIMLERVFPPGTILSNILIEVPGSVSFGRQMGTYPVLVGIPQQLSRGTLLNAAVVSYGARSLTALPVPIQINRLSASALKWIPGISKKLAQKVLAGRPFADVSDLRSLVTSEEIAPFLPLMEF